MFKSFVAWFDSYIVDAGLASVLKSAVGLLAFAGLVGSVFGVQVLRAGALLALLVVALGLAVVLLADRRNLKRDYAVHRKYLSRYCDFIIDHREEPLISVSEWKQATYVQRNGDVREVVSIKAVALREEMYFIRFHAGCEWDQPEKYRRRVRVEARSIKVNGTSGPRWHVTGTWIETGKLQSIVHFDTPVREGQEIRLVMERTWPSKCRPLMCEHESDAFTIRTTKLIQIQNIEYKVVLPKGLDAVYEPIGFTEEDPNSEVLTGTDLEGRATFTYVGRDLRVFDHFGMRLELT